MKTAFKYRCQDESFYDSTSVSRKQREALRSGRVHFDLKEKSFVKKRV